LLLKAKLLLLKHLIPPTPPYPAQVVSSVWIGASSAVSLNINKDDRHVLPLFAGTIAFFGLWLDLLVGSDSKRLG